MNVIRYTAAPPYSAPGHYGMSMRRLQGREAGPSDTLWLGISEIAPIGGTTLDTSPVEKMYVVLEGEVTISNGSEEVVLRSWDSCRIAANERRTLKNNTDKPATILLAMPLQSATA